jgi:hypothetical protein
MENMPRFDCDITGKSCEQFNWVNYKVEYTRKLPNLVDALNTIFMSELGEVIKDEAI